MLRYTIHEVQSINDTREEIGFTTTLRSAKATATRIQLFQGTVLVIRNAAGKIVSHKPCGGRWIDAA